MMAFLQLFCLILLFSSKSEGTSEQPEVSVFTVATEKNHHGLERFLRSARVYDINVEILGLGTTWKGGNMEHPGGGQKVKLLKKKLKTLKKLKDRDRIILFTDSYDVMFLGGIKKIVEKFQNTHARVLFSAEPFCWPDATLAKQYPDLSQHTPYLNSGGFIGYYEDVVRMLDIKDIKNEDDDQLYYTKIFLNEESRVRLRIKLDYKSEIFQNLNGAMSDVELVINTPVGEFPYIKNVVSNTRPLIVHGNGPAKLILNQYSNYLAKAWSVYGGCSLCDEKRISLEEDALPTVLIAVFIEQPTPFLEEFLNQIEMISYPKKKIHFLLHNNENYHEAEIDAFYKAHFNDYLSSKRIKPSDFVSESEARNMAIERCAASACDYVFSIDSVARISPSTLRYLLSTGYDVVAPLLVREGHVWSNFWGGVNSAGFYARSSDYMDIVTRKLKGIWNVPYINHCYLLNMKLFRNNNDVSYTSEVQDPDMAFCARLRRKGIMMYVSNEIDLGHLVNPETFDITLTNPDVYQVIDNKIEWERRYLHTEYKSNFVEGRNHSMPCPDVYWFPIMSTRFCKEWIEVMEAYGKWSDGSNNDKRLEGGYEAVPTRDIHMKQVGLEKQWLYILKEYVRPLQELVFTGYYHNPPVSLMNFVVRYRPDEQPSLRPHHDSSTYTINIALNTPHVDYEGGGCRFIRYNCSVRNTKRGWMLMHPGRLTHFHEGLRVTKGTRYIMISFIDP